LFADFRGIHEFVPLDQDLKASGLQVVGKKFISSNVLEALKSQEEEKQRFLLGIEQPELRAALRDFIGARGSFIYEGLKSGRMTYLSYVLQKLLQN
jgi:hypothetical protein